MTDKTITVIYYDDMPKDELKEVITRMSEALGEDHKLIAIPKNFDVLLECSIDQLIHIKSIIDTTINVKLLEEQSEEADNFTTTFQKTEYPM